MLAESNLLTAILFQIKKITKANNKNLSDENEDEERDNTTDMVSLSTVVLPEGCLVRSKTMPLSLGAGIKKLKDSSSLKVASSNNFQNDRLKVAKEEAEKAIKV